MRIYVYIYIYENSVPRPPIKLHNIAYRSKLQNTAYYSIQNASLWESSLIDMVCHFVEPSMITFGEVFDVSEVLKVLRFGGF